MAEGNPDASEWKSLIQREAGLTDEQGAILKEVAYACNQILSDQPTERTEIVSAAMDELRSRLGEEAFQSLAAYVHAKLGPGLEEVSGTPGPVPPETVTTGNPDPAVEALVAGEINVSTSISKLSNNQVFAVCDTSMDSATAQYYPRTLTFCGLFGDDGSQRGIVCDTSFLGQCSEILGGFPGTVYQVQGAHNLVLYQGTCEGSTTLVDPLRYCRPNLQYFNIGGTIYPQGGETACVPFLPPYNACGLAQTAGRFIGFVGLSPAVVTLYAGQQQRFFTNIPAVIVGFYGPGTLQGNLYTAPATITSPQTATIVACDADPNFRDDCSTATIRLEPLQVDLTPPGDEVLPGENLDFTATVTPGGTGLAVQWTLEEPAYGASITPDGANSTKATFEAPGKDAITGTQEIFVKACVKPNASTEVCGRAKVRVPKIDMFFIANPATHTLPPNGTIQFTTIVSGSGVAREVRWEPFPDLFDASLTVDTPDTLVATYKASATERVRVLIRACLKQTVEDFCTDFYPLDIVDAIRIDSVTGDWTAGQLDSSFTIAGSGFGTNPTVTFNGGLPGTITSASDSLITGKVTFSLAMGGSPVSFVLRTSSGTTVNFPSFGQTSPTIAPFSRLEVSPVTAEVRQGESRPFSAICLTAKGAICNSPDAALAQWTATQGTIDPVGLSVQYRAPASVPASTTATVKACWSNNTLCAPPALVTLLPPAVETTVTVSPKTATVRAGRTQPFTAAVANNTNTAVTWSIQPATPDAGSINQSGLYTAPATLGSVTTVTVTATSQADGTKKDTATVTLVPPSPVIIGPPPNPRTVTCGQTLTFTITVSGGDPATLQYAVFRRRTGGVWIPAVTAPAWQSGNAFSWTPTCTDAGIWELLIWVRDAYTLPNENVYGYAASYNPGTVEVVAPLTVTTTPSPAAAVYGNAITWTATASGGIPASTRYALFRRRAGTTPWTPDVTAPNWQTDNRLTWTPASADTGTWEISVWVKDGSTPANANTYGYASYYNPGPVRVVAPLTVTSTSSPVAVYSGNAITWTATAINGDPATTQFAMRRRPVGTTAWTPATLVWQTSNVLSWTPASTETGSWEISILVKDVTTPSTPGYAASTNPGNVQVVTPLTVTATPSPASASAGFPITWTATASGGTSVNRQYAFFRRRAGTTPWTPDVTAASWQASNVFNWTPAGTDTGTWEIIVWARDSATPAGMNAYGFAAYYNAGPVQVVPPLSLTVTPSPESRPHNDTRLVTWTATASGGVPSTYQYAFFRRRAGTTAWTPDVTAPAWQTSNTFNWDPTSADVGTWDTYVWVKDSNTPANMNTYGYAAGYNSGPVTITAPLCLSSTASPAYATTGTAITWTATPCGGYPPTTQLALFRRRAGTTAWTPATTAPAWQSSNVFTWTPSSADTGTWEILLWVRDDDTPPSPGYGTTYNPGNVQVVAPLTLSVTASPAWSLSGNAITWTATAGGGTGTNVQYAFFRRRSGTTPWTPSVTAPSWQTSRTFSWTPAAADAGNWDIYVWVKDSATPPGMNTYGYGAGANPGGVQVVAPMTLSGTVSPASAYAGTTLTWTANATGNTPSTTQYAFFRRRAGTTPWTPDVTAPAWQASNVLIWIPASTDTGTWETYIWVRDGNTPANMNTYGHAAWYNSGTVQIVTPLTVSGTGSPAASNYGNTLTWTANASGGTGTSVQYAFFRRRAGATAWTPSVTAPAWQTSNVMSWTPASADAGTWETYIWVKDSATPAGMNTYGYAAGYNPGPVQIVAPLTVSGTGSPSAVYSGTALSWTANANGGTGTGIRYAFFRRRAGATSWTPSVTSPAWQTSNSFSWTPASTDTGTWEINVWVKDSATPANQNAYGYAASYNPGSVQVVTPPSVSGTSSPSQAYYGQTITWTANISGGTGTGVRYAFFRRRAGDANWTPSVNSPAWQTSNSYSWTPSSADVGTWETYVWVKDSATPANMNTYGQAAWYNSGTVQVVAPAPLTVSGSGSPSTSPWGTSISWTANASGGVPGTIRYALFRRRAGTSNWIPDVTAPSWQSSNVLRWTPSSADVGTWEIIIWVKDVNTTPSQNGYGFAAYYNAQPVQVY